MKNESDRYEREFLSRKFPSLSGNIRRGEFRVIDVDDNGVKELVVRISPSVKLTERIVQQILTELFGGYSSETIEFRWQSSGLEIKTICNGRKRAVFDLPV